jgi:PIN domain nuclease of toxin-antitoxin system
VFPITAPAWITKSICIPVFDSSQVQEAIGRSLATRSVVVSTFRTWEIAMLIVKGKLQFSIDLGEWIRQSEQISGLTF